MSAPTLHLVPTTPPPATAPRLRPQDRRRVPVAGRRLRVAVVDPRGPGALRADDLRRLAQIADVTFHRLTEAPDGPTCARILKDVDVLVATPDLLPVIDGRLLDALPTWPRVVLLEVDDLRFAELAS